MPTTDDYEQGAKDWRRDSGALARLASSVRDSLPVSAIGHNPVRAVLDAALGASVQHLAGVAEHYRELATTCDRRAEICRGFDVEWAQFEEAAENVNVIEVSVDPSSAPQPPNTSEYPWYARSTT